MDAISAMLKLLQDVFGIHKFIETIIERRNMARDEISRQRFAWSMLDVVRILTDIYVTGVEIHRCIARKDRQLSDDKTDTITGLTYNIKRQWANIELAIHLLDHHRDWITLTDNSLYVGFTHLAEDKKDILTKINAKLADHMNQKKLILINEDEWMRYITTCNDLFEMEQTMVQKHVKGLPIDTTRMTAFYIALDEAETLIDTATKFQIPIFVNKDSFSQLRDILESSLSQNKLNEIYALAESLRNSMIKHFSIKDLVPTISSRDVRGSVFGRSYYKL